MISLKKYLDSDQTAVDEQSEELLAAALTAYGSTLQEIGASGLSVCPTLGDGLKRSLDKLRATLSPQMGCEKLAETDAGVRGELRGWGQRASEHYQQKGREVKELLLVLAQAAESVGERDQRCAGQISEVTRRLKDIAGLDDLTQIRSSIERSALELKNSIDRMASEGKAALDQLRAQVTTYQARLEHAEEIAARDALTGLRSRLTVENLIEARMCAGAKFCIAIVDIDGFKKVNDDYGHIVGDELLKLFASELRSVCNSTDVIGRWGGDEFIILLNRDLTEAKAQRDRLQKWVCGNYPVQAGAQSIKINVDASIGLAEHRPGEQLRELFARADAAMYENKAATRAGNVVARH
ncbi:MAG TPA: GGDEF domain-containing protein [Terracidiphilus sp.]|jgi:diguanylate cyclase (GGDEF)-like protein|nr:GGDEF domain-containing protein [Terracidiphilus sp.]